MFRLRSQRAGAIKMLQANTYEELKMIRGPMFSEATNYLELNQAHDQIIQRVVQLAISNLEGQGMAPPTSFSFFMMGSAGRFEQGIWSDQDHGIVYEKESAEAKIYFLLLGKEITQGLDLVGYERCEGQVMSSNPMWCQSLQSWREQIQQWLTSSSWDSIRYVLIFMDARVLFGDPDFITSLKEIIFSKTKESSEMLNRLVQNTKRFKKSIGILGQLLVEPYGPFSGSINLKESALLPCINAVRLLSIKEEIQSCSTIERFNELALDNSYKELMDPYLDVYQKLLAFRFTYQQKYEPTTYEASHFLQISHLSGAQVRELKMILRKVFQLNQLSQRIIEKGCK